MRDGDERSRGQAVGLALAWFVSLNLRSVILAVPPVLPQIRSDLGLTFAEAGAVTSLPVLCLSLAAIPGALLASRFGPRRVVGVALFVLGAGAALRILPFQPFAIFAATAGLSIANAAAQPAMAAIVRSWFPTSVERASAVISNALNVGGLLGAVLTVGMVGFGWRASFVFWALPVLLAAALWFRFAPGRSAGHVATPTGLRRLARNVEVWRAGGLFGGQSIAYFTTTTWIPFLLGDGPQAYVGLVLAVFSVATVLPSFLLGLVRFPYATSRVYFAAGGLLMTGGALALVMAPLNVAWLAAGLLGLGSSMVFVGTIAAPALLADDDSRVGGYSALMLSFGYLLSFFGPALGGFLVDRTHDFRAPFWVVLVSGLAVIVMAVTRPQVRRGEPDSAAAAL